MRFSPLLATIATTNVERPRRQLTGPHAFARRKARKCPSYRQELGALGLRVTASCAETGDLRLRLEYQRMNILRDARDLNQVAPQ